MSLPHGGQSARRRSKNPNGFPLDLGADVRREALARLRTTPAMTAGVTKRLWKIGDIVTVLENWEAREAR
jgi:hypothetical protein